MQITYNLCTFQWNLLTELPNEDRHVDLFTFYCVVYDCLEKENVTVQGNQ